MLIDNLALPGVDMAQELERVLLYGLDWLTWQRKTLAKS